MSLTTDLIALEQQYGANNYEPIPVVLNRGEGVYVWDVEGKRYYDFLSGICAVSQGHCHPHIVKALTDQAKQLTLVSRAFYSDAFGEFAQAATAYFGFERILVMNTGVEAVETAMKLCRKWGYEKKGIPDGQAKIVVCSGNFHGRTLAAVSAGVAPDAKSPFAPLLPGFVMIPFNDLPALIQALRDPQVAGFLVEPIQGEGGVVVPGAGYLKSAFELCRAANVLFLADEVQTGIGRTGRRLACDHEGVHPDILILGKALSGGMFPISAILADNAVMSAFRPGDHGSTFGGNPLACRVAKAALEVVQREELPQRAEAMGELFRAELQGIRPDLVAEVRGKGLLNAVVFHQDRGIKAWDICLTLRDHGLLAKNTRDHIIRFAPPLVIDRPQMLEAIGIVKRVLSELA